MRIIRNACVLVVLSAGALTLSTPASAVDQAKWTKVCTNFLGLRSAATQVDTNGAGYGMNDGNTVPMNCLRAPPDNWDTTLAATIDLIKGFPNSGTRYLLIVGDCPGLARDYPGAFPKCNRVRGAVLAATPNTLANYTAAELVEWVINNI